MNDYVNEIIALRTKDATGVTKFLSDDGRIKMVDGLERLIFDSYKNGFYKAAQLYSEREQEKCLKCSIETAGGITLVILIGYATYKTVQTIKRKKAEKELSVTDENTKGNDIAYDTENQINDMEEQL